LSDRAICVPSDLYDRLAEKAKERNKSVDDFAEGLLEIGLILLPAFPALKKYAESLRTYQERGS